MLYRWDGAGGASCAAPHGRSCISALMTAGEPCTP